MKSWIFAVLGLAYAGSYLLLALLTSGGGHGPRFTFAPAIPYGIGLLVFPVFGYLMGDLSSKGIKAAYGVLLVVHCAAVTSFVLLWWPEDLPYANRAWEASPLNILLPVIWYLAGQVFLWTAFIRSVFADGGRSPSNKRLQPTPR